MPTDALTIRPARHDDEDFLLQLLPRLADFPLPAWRTAEEIARGDRQILVDALHGRIEHAAILVAESMPGGQRAGYVFATTKHDYFTREAHAHVEVIAVEEGAGRRGVVEGAQGFCRVEVERLAAETGLGTDQGEGLQALQGELFLSFANEAQGAGLWKSADGEAWEQVMSHGWGDWNNTYASYFDKSVTVFRSTLYWATINYANGGEVWRMVKLVHALHTPLVMK